MGGRSQPHRLVGWFYAATLGVSVGRHVLDPHLATARPPLTSTALLAYYADHALVAGAPFVALAAWVRHFAGRPLRPVLGAYLGTVAGIVIYKEATGASLVPVQLGVEAAASLAGALVVGRALLARSRHVFQPDAVHLILMFQLGASAVRIALPYRGNVVETWVDVRSMEITLNSVLLTGYLVAFAGGWRARATKRGPGG